MIYSIKHVKDWGFDIKGFVLEHLTEYEIFSYYLGYAFIPDKAFNSPFRKDRNPSFGIYHNKDGTLKYNDLGNKKYKGDCFNFVQQKLSLPNYTDAVIQVYKDLITNRIKNISRVTPIQYSGGKETKLSKQITFVPKKRFSKIGLKYWEEIGLSQKDLDFFNIKSALILYVDDHPVWWDTPENPIFIYKTFNKIKAYRPLSKTKTKKWISNCTRFDIQGWEQLPLIHNTSTLIITKSLKDVATLRKLGYIAIAPPSEGVLIPPVAMKMLKENFYFKDFLLLYDNDDGGLTGVRKMVTKYRSDYTIKYKFFPVQFPKDVSALRREFGEHRTITYLKRMLGYDPDTTIQNI